MCSWRNAWYSQSRTPPQESPPRLAPSSGSYTPVLVKHTFSHCAICKKPERADRSCNVTHEFRSGAPWINSTWLDVVSDDAHVLVAVRTRVLVPEADHVAELVHHDAKLIAVLPYGDGLRAPAPPAHVGATPGGREDRYTSRRLLKKEFYSYVYLILTSSEVF